MEQFRTDVDALPEHIKNMLNDVREDSPLFRDWMHKQERTTEDLQKNIKKLLRVSRDYMKNGTRFNDDIVNWAHTSSEFGELSREQTAHSLGYMNERFCKETDVFANVMSRFSEIMEEYSEAQKLLFINCQVGFTEPLDSFLTEEAKLVKESQKRYESAQSEYDSILARFVGQSKSKAALSDDDSGAMYETKKKADEARFQHVAELNAIQAKKDFEFLERMTSFVFGMLSFHHQCWERLNAMEPWLKDVSARLQEQRRVFNDELSINATARQLCLSAPAIESTSTTATERSGYLFKRSSNVVRDWKKRYFTVKEGKFVYYRSHKDMKPQGNIDLMLATVKNADELDRNFCFEVVSMSRNYYLQASSDEDKNMWMAVISNSIATQINTGGAISPSTPAPVPTSSPATGKLVSRMSMRYPGLALVADVSGNDVCADCMASGPQWASTNLGVVICIECSGIHRSLGSHVSKVRSLTLDKWPSTLMECMKGLGNAVANGVWVASDQEGPGPRGSREAKEAWIKSKYVDREHLMTIECDAASMHEAVANKDYGMILAHIGNGIDVNTCVAGQTALHRACSDGCNAVAELLLQWGADCNARDSDRRTPLHIAAINNDGRLIRMLLQAHADPCKTDINGMTPINAASSDAIAAIMEEVVQRRTKVGMKSGDSDDEDVITAADPFSMPRRATTSTPPKLPPARRLPPAPRSNSIASPPRRSLPSAPSRTMPSRPNE